MGTDSTHHDANTLADDIPSTTEVSKYLIQGGDDRLHLDDSGVNKYYCAPRPLSSSVVIRGSCTCSAPTREGFAAAQKTLQALNHNSFDDSMRDVRRRLSNLLRIDVAHDIVLHPSGSDAELIPLIVASARAQRLGCPVVVNIVVAAGEVGSGTAPASGGRHFSAVAPSGGAVENGGILDGFPTSTEVVQLKPRTRCGAFNEKFDVLVRQACDDAVTRLGDPFIVLHAVDGSKTGLRVPSKSLIEELCKRFDSRILVVLDACQGRSEPAELNWYVQRGAVALITASKFYGAPGFCGAVVLPKAASADLDRCKKLPSGLKEYLTAYEVPETMPELRKHLGYHWENRGLLLRWACGLREMELFESQGDSGRAAIRDWVNGVRKLVMKKERLNLVMDEDEDLTRLGGVNSVVCLRLLCGERFLDAAELRRVHRWLTLEASRLLPPVATSKEKEAAALTCMVGQPVNLGAFGVLRLAFGAPMARVIGEYGLHDALRKDDLILDKMSILAKYFDSMR